MNIEEIGELIEEYLEKKDLDFKVENPFSDYFYGEKAESKGERLIFIENTHEAMIKQLEEEKGELARQRQEVDGLMAVVNEEFMRSMIDNAHLESILQKIDELKQLHAATVTQALHLYPLNMSDQHVLHNFDRKIEELQGIVDNVRKDAEEVRSRLDESREEVQVLVQEFEEKKSHEENKLELLVVIQNVVRKKREQIVERNAMLVNLKAEIIEMEVGFVKDRKR